MSQGPLDDQYEELAAAIIKTACKDYLQALRRIRLHPGNPEIIDTLDDLEEFFRSDQFDALTLNLDGLTLIKMLQEKERKEFFQSKEDAEKK